MSSFSTRRTALLLAAASHFLAPVQAFACEAREVAGGSALLDVCETAWSFGTHSEGEDIFLCTGAGCEGETVLRVTLGEMTAEDRALGREALFEHWTGRVVPESMGGFDIQMLEPISIREIGDHEGIYIPLRLIGTGGIEFFSLAFRVPHEDSYVILNATGQAEYAPLLALLEDAAQGLDIKENEER